jgi:hypothetical protein
MKQSKDSILIILLLVLSQSISPKLFQVVKTMLLILKHVLCDRPGIDHKEICDRFCWNALVVRQDGQRFIPYSKRALFDGSDEFCSIMITRELTALRQDGSQVSSALVSIDTWRVLSIHLDDNTNFASVGNLPRFRLRK